jgi:hypothetical protein
MEGAFGADPFFTTRRNQTIVLAAHHGLPVIYPWKEYTEIGGLMSYGPSLTRVYHAIALYAADLVRHRVAVIVAGGVLSLRLLAAFDVQCMMDPIQRAIAKPPRKIVMQRAPRRKVF